VGEDPKPTRVGGGAVARGTNRLERLALALAPGRQWRVARGRGAAQVPARSDSPRVPRCEPRSVLVPTLWLQLRQALPPQTPPSSRAAVVVRREHAEYCIPHSPLIIRTAATRPRTRAMASLFATSPGAQAVQLSAPQLVASLGHRLHPKECLARAACCARRSSAGGRKAVGAQRGAAGCARRWGQGEKSNAGESGDFQIVVCG
jgi:hypothetical protein